MGRRWHAGHRKRGAGRLFLDIGRPKDRELVLRDRKAHQLIGRKLNSRTGPVRHDGCGRLAHGDGRSGEEQTQRRGVNNMNSAQHGGLLLGAGPPVRHIRLKSVRRLLAGDRC